MNNFPDYTGSSLFGQPNQYASGVQQDASPSFPNGSFPTSSLSSSAETTSQNSAVSASSRITPTESTVVIGKGSLPKKAPGNRKLRDMVRDRLQEYASANSKIAKSSIVTDIYFVIEESCRREGCPTPFLRYDRNGYSQISETLGREKITSTFRDCLSDRYRSSSKNKVARRRLENQKKAEHKRGLILRGAISAEQQQQQQRQQKPMVPILPSPDDCASSLPAFVPSSCHPQQQLQKPYDSFSNKGQRNFLDICAKLFCSGNDINNNNGMPSSSSSTTPLFEFDPSFLEPVPIPELDESCSCSSSSCSLQDSDTGANAKNRFDNGFPSTHRRNHQVCRRHHYQKQPQYPSTN